MTFELLAKPVGTVDLLLFLHGRGPTSVTSILSETGMNNEKFYNAAERLKSLGLAYEYGEPSTTGRVHVTLTRAGEEMARLLEPAVNVLSGTVISLEDELERLESQGDAATAVRRTELLRLLADKEFEAGRWDEAERHASRLLELVRDRGDLAGEIHARLARGRVAQNRDRHEEATQELQTVVRLANSANDVLAVMEAECLMGAILERQGKWAEARERYEEAERRAARSNERLWAARSRLGLARILGRQGRLSESFELHSVVVGEFEAMGAGDELPRAYASIGATAYHMDRPDALTWLEKAIGASRRAGDVSMEAFGLSNAAGLWIDGRDFGRAEAALRRALALQEGLGDRSGVVAAALNFANLRAAQGRWSEAEEYFDRAYDASRQTGNRYQQASVLFNRGQMMKRRERPQEARALLGEAKTIFAELGSGARARRCEEELAELIPRGTR